MIELWARGAKLQISQMARNVFLGCSVQPTHLVDCDEHSQLGLQSIFSRNSRKFCFY